MNRINTLLSYIVLLTLLLFATNCSKEEDITENTLQEQTDLIETAGVSADDFETFDGEIGFVLNARNIAKKGHRPSKAVINVTANTGNYSQTLDLNTFSFLGQIKLSNKDLSEAAKAELTEGVPIAVSILNENDDEIISQEFSGVVFNSQNSPMELNVANLEETELNKTISLSENRPYYVQEVNQNAVPLANSMRVNRNSGFDDILTISSGTTFQGISSEPDMIFNFFKFPNEFNTYGIRLEAYGQFVAVSNASDRLVKMFGFNNFDDVLNASTVENYKFIIEKVSEGRYIFKSKLTGQSFKTISGVGIAAGTSGVERYFRIISNTWDWNVQDLGITSLQPILAEPTTSFGANSTLTNCGNGTLSQTIGTNETETVTNILGWEESFSFTGSVSSSFTATVGTEFEAGFFGTSATYNAEVSTTQEIGFSATTQSSTFNEEINEVEEALFFQRTVTVPSGSASLVYDVAQTYNNTIVQFVQRVRLSATDENGSVSGELLQSQIQFSGFNGVVTDVQQGHIDISVKGFLELGKFFESQSSVQDSPVNCN
ncbi:hypothetical protein [Winogradskyella immobilis]|uniref:DUF5689 domain-containing protein n=1 Tax=Winogradskyella immobilis TaxID=2816852 RepID=A0ABS8EQ89_9FLAO|nr:hypothetical protein [Winogradskyella immobilis]MCC1485399.1 hypothetical protein [Winogradskyella immobilis]MCG0017491.1 hypothetical protein [Winogradskyella immobilis]